MTPFGVNGNERIKQKRNKKEYSGKTIKNRKRKNFIEKYCCFIDKRCFYINTILILTFKLHNKTVLQHRRPNSVIYLFLSHRYYYNN